jgi:hypothetical protein
VKSAPVAATPVETTPATDNGEAVEETPTDPVEVYGAATLANASISADNVILRWHQTNALPESGYNILIDGEVAEDLGGIASTTATVGGLDLSEQHCFEVQAQYTQVTPAQYFISNSLCTDAQQSVNQAPEISGTPSNSVDVSGSYFFRPRATDSDNDDLTFSVTNLPAWARFNNQTGRLSGSPTADDVGDYGDIVITVSDGTDEASLGAFAITVNPGVTEPVTGSISLNWVAPTTRTDGVTLNLSEIGGYCVYVGTTRDNLQMVADVSDGDSTGYVLDDLDLGDYYVAVTVYDQDNNMSDYSNVLLRTAMN